MGFFKDVGTGLVCVERECGERWSLKSCGGFVWAEREREGSRSFGRRRREEREKEKRKKKGKIEKEKNNKNKCWCGLIKLFFIIFKWLS